MKRKTRGLSRISSTANTQTNPTQHYVPVEIRLLLMTQTFEQLAEYGLFLLLNKRKQQQQQKTEPPLNAFSGVV